MRDVLTERKGDRLTGRKDDRSTGTKDIDGLVPILLKVELDSFVGSWHS